MLNNLPLSERGVILSYFYKLGERMKEIFDSEHITFENFTNSECGVMIYHK